MCIIRTACYDQEENRVLNEHLRVLLLVETPCVPIQMRSTYHPSPMMTRAVSVGIGVPRTSERKFGIRCAA